MAVVIWFTGLSGSGKTTVALELKIKLESFGKSVEIIDGDAIRSTRHKHLGFSREDIRENNKEIAKLCSRKKEVTDFILVPIISPHCEDRNMAREIIGDGFLELHINCPLKECIERDVKGLYRKALSGQIDNFIGVSGSNPYEIPENPDVVINTANLDVESGVEEVIDYLVGKSILTRMDKFVDLHMHTNASDGTHTPEELVDIALSSGLKVIGITDHDTVAGVQRAIDYAKGKDIVVVPGIEISCAEPNLGFRDVHVIGLFIDHNDKNIGGAIGRISLDREQQKKKIIKRLHELGFEVLFEELGNLNSVGRPHIAQALLEKYPKEFSSINDVFDKYLAVGKPGYVDRDNTLSLRDAVKVIQVSGGLSFLAHPGVYGQGDSSKLIKLFKKCGGDGIETYYPYHFVFPQLKLDKKSNLELVKFYREMALDMGLLESGGSDFHGGIRDSLLKIEVPYKVFEILNFNISNR